MTKESDGSYSFTEDYGNFKGIHNIKLINENSIQGTQKGKTGLVSNYEMTRIQSTTGAPMPKSARISGTYRIAIVSSSDGSDPSPNFATAAITDDGENVISDWFREVISYNRQTGDLIAAGAYAVGKRPNEIRLKFKISGSNITATGTETMHYTSRPTLVWQVKWTKISN